MSHRPARVAAQTTIAIALLACLLVARQDDPAAPRTQAPPPGRTAGPEQPAGHGGALLREPADPTGTSAEQPAEQSVAQPVARPRAAPPEAASPGGAPPGAVPRQPSGFGTLTSRQASLRMAAAGVGASRAAEHAAVVAMPESGEDSQEWLVRPAPDGAVIVRSPLVSTDDDVGGPLVLTADPDGSVYLSRELPDDGQQDAGQRWRVEDVHPPLGPPERSPSDGRTTIGLRLHAHRGGCLVEQGYGERLAVGSCDDPRSWWTAEGLTG
ncbi:hypothetical protein [Kitasatospora sp. NPDC097691]|uniref:RICIN domain-containing protein n=1 Tax=Kitasatospora sp. NPDC097691 TaxID=3157231 RepID=UPI003319FBE3